MQVVIIFKAWRRQLLFKFLIMSASGVGADNVANDADAIAVTWNNSLFFSFLYPP